MTGITTTLAQLEDGTAIWGWGKWARTAWVREMKMPGWVKEIKTLDRERELNRIIEDISDEYGEMLDRKISEMGKDGAINPDVLVNIYVNLMPVPVCARDLKLTNHTVRQERQTALAMLWGSLSKY